MSKAVLISVGPRWCELIAPGMKTIELRKTRPTLTTPFKCYIYCTKHPKGLITVNKSNEVCNRKVIGEFVCDTILRHCEMANADIAERQALVRREEIFEYAKGKEVFGWHISDLVIYDRPKELSEFTGLRKTKFGYALTDIRRPPQSWCYVEEMGVRE